MSIQTLVWKKETFLQSAGKPTCREGHSIVFIPDMAKYLLFGGISSCRHADLFIYDSSKIFCARTL
jgi:hypothetical protein